MEPGPNPSAANLATERQEQTPRQHMPGTSGARTIVGPSGTPQLEWLSAKDRLWHTRYKELLEFREMYGHCNVPQRFEPNRKLGTWVDTQRQSRRLGTLSESRFQRLEAVNFLWRGFGSRLPLVDDAVGLADAGHPGGAARARRTSGGRGSAQSAELGQVRPKRKRSSPEERFSGDGPNDDDKYANEGGGDKSVSTQDDVMRERDRQAAGDNGDVRRATMGGGGNFGESRTYQQRRAGVQSTGGRRSSAYDDDEDYNQDDDDDDWTEEQSKPSKKARRRGQTTRERNSNSNYESLPMPPSRSVSTTLIPSTHTQGPHQPQQQQQQQYQDFLGQVPPHRLSTISYPSQTTLASRSYSTVANVAPYSYPYGPHVVSQHFQQQQQQQQQPPALFPMYIFPLASHHSLLDAIEYQFV